MAAFEDAVAWAAELDRLGLAEYFAMEAYVVEG